MMAGLAWDCRVLVQSFVDVDISSDTTGIISHDSNSDEVTNWGPVYTALQNHVIYLTKFLELYFNFFDKFKWYQMVL